MGYENVIVEIGDDFVAALTLNRPNNLNTFNVPLAKELSQAFLELDSEPQGPGDCPQRGRQGLLCGHRCE